MGQVNVVITLGLAEALLQRLRALDRRLKVTTLSRAERRAMKPSAVIINISRGTVIDEGALVRALKEGWIAGAGLDVFEREPLPSDSELWGMDNVVVTPHVSGGTPAYMERAVALFYDNLRRYLAGQPLRNVVDPKRGY